MIRWQQQDDRISIRAFAIGSALVTIVTILFVLAAWGENRLEVERLQPQATRPRISARVNDMDMTLFEQQTLAERIRFEDVRRLHSYEWVDRDARIVRIPVHRAMQVFLQRQANEGTR